MDVLIMDLFVLFNVGVIIFMIVLLVVVVVYVGCVVWNWDCWLVWVRYWVFVGVRIWWVRLVVVLWIVVFEGLRWKLIGMMLKMNLIRK